MTNTVREQIMAIWESGVANMLDINAVQYHAFHKDFYELVTYLEENKKEYWNFIMTGEAPMED